LTKLLAPILTNLASLDPGRHSEAVKALDGQLRGNQDPVELFQNLSDFILQIQEDIWSEKMRAMERIGAIMKKLGETEKNFMISVAASLDYLEKSARGFSQAVADGLDEIGVLTEPARSPDLDDLCSRLSEKVNRLYEQVELKKKADLVRFEVLDQDRWTRAKNLENTQRDYEAFSIQSHEMLREIENLRAVSLRDPLTGIYNRRAYDRQITATIAAVEIEELKTAALAVFDIDHFREFNNNYGHLAGDRVLTHVARVTAETLRGDDFFFRYGGDEFVIIMPNTTRNMALIVGEKVRQSLGMVEFKIYKNSDKLARVTVSVGVAEMEKGDDPGRFFARADTALYRAKKGGRNQVLAEPDKP
jgi:diguanylate cyclase (GGDEF)-like protein